MSVSGKSKGGNKRNQSPRGRERGMMRRSETENTMKKKTEKQTGGAELGRECDLSKLKGGVRGKYIAGFRAGTNLVLLDVIVLNTIVKTPPIKFTKIIFP